MFFLCPASEPGSVPKLPIESIKCARVTLIKRYLFEQARPKFTATD